LIGAGMAATFSYIAATVYQFIVFIRNTKIVPADFLFRKDDIIIVVTGIKKLLSDQKTL
jgi:Na+-driven multidrug efflux pump